MKLFRTAACVLVWAFWSEATPAQDVPVPTFGADVEAVYVDVFVTSKGKSAPRLTDRDFELRDNGVLQAVRVVSLEAIPLRAVLVFDASASVAGAKLRHLRSAGRAFLNGLQPEDEPSLLTFSHEIRLREPPASAPHSLADALDRLRPTGGTSLLDALFAALKLVERSAGRPVIVVFTDGEDNFSWLGEAELLELAEESNALIYAVGVAEQNRLSVGAVSARHHGHFVEGRSGRRSELLREIASITGGRAWDVRSSSRLEEAFLEILADLHSRYLLTYSPERVDEGGWHELQVRVKNRKAKVRARRGYYRARATSGSLGGSSTP